MRRLLVLLFITGLIFYGCDGGDSPTPPPDEEEGPTFAVLAGSIEGWNAGENKALKLYAYPDFVSSSGISSSGSFTLHCTKPSEKQLYNIADNFVSPSTISISDSSAVFNYGALMVYDGEKSVGSIVRSNKKTAGIYYIEEVGSYIIEYWYFDKETNIVGFNETFEGSKTATYNYDVYGKAGWNYVIKTLTSNTVESKTYGMVTGIPPESKYYYFSY